MVNSGTQAHVAGLMRTLSIWTKQLTLEWPLDWVVPGDLARAASNSGWVSPTDKIPMMLGLIAEMYVNELATNDLDDSKGLPKSIDFRNICQGMLVDFSNSPEEDWDFPFPATGRVVLLQPTPLGLSVSDAVDGDIDLVTLEDRQPWIDSFVPSDQLESRDLRQPGAVARAVLKLGGSGPFGPSTFFSAVDRLGFDDPRDQAVAGFGALSQLVTTGAIIPCAADPMTPVQGAGDMATVFADLAQSWFTYAANLSLYTGSEVSRPAPPDSLEKQAFMVPSTTTTSRNKSVQDHPEA